MADNGFNFENKDFEEQAINDNEDNAFYIPTTAVTSGSLYQRLELPRNIAIIGLVALGVGSLSFGLIAFNSGINSPRVANTPTQLEQEKDKDKLIAQLKAEQSLGESLKEQKQLLEEAKEREAKKAAETVATSRASKESKVEAEKIIEPPQVIAQAPAKTERIVQQRQRPKPVSQTQPEFKEIQSPPVAPPPQIISKAPTPPQLASQSVSKAEEGDPYEKWKQEGQSGGISVEAGSTANPVEEVSQEPRPNEESKAVLASYPTTPNSEVPAPEDVAREVSFEPAPAQQPKQQLQSRTYDIGAGKRMKANLQNNVVLDGRVDRNQKYPLKITKAVKSTEGKVLIPDNTRVMARVASATTSGNIRMNVESVVVPAGSGVMEKRLPYGSVQVLTRGGSPLKAKIRYPRVALPKETVVATTRIDTTTRNKSLRSGNYPPSRQERIIALRRSLNGGRRASRPQLKRYPTLTLKKGTKVQLFVNESFNL